MFSVLVTKSFGASEAIQAAYLIERRLDLVGSTEPVLQVRQRSTGLRQWLKASDGTPESARRLDNELVQFSHIEHPHLLTPLEFRPPGDEIYLLYDWQAEQPLSGDALGQLPLSTCAHLAGVLLTAVSYLHGRQPPIAHNSLLLENLWLVPGANWLRLSGFNHAVADAGDHPLQQDRRAAWALARQLVNRGDDNAARERSLDQAGSAWVQNPAKHWARLLRELQQLVLNRVTADL